MWHFLPNHVNYVEENQFSELGDTCVLKLQLVMEEPAMQYLHKLNKHPLQTKYIILALLFREILYHGNFLQKLVAGSCVLWF